MALLLFALFSLESEPSCGADALFLCLQRLKSDTSLEVISSELPRQGVDASLLELQHEAENLGFHTRALKWSGNLARGSAPAIIKVVLPSKSTHFVAILETRGNQALVAERSHTRWVTLDTLRAAEWDGVALHVSRSQIWLFLLGRIWHCTCIVAIVLAATTHFVSRRLKACHCKDRISFRQQRKETIHPTGITIVEVLVVLSIISLLMSLLAPAVQSSLVRARAMSCSNNLRQIGLAMHSFDSSYGQFPPMSPSDLQPVSAPVPVTYPVSTHYCLLPYLDLQSIQSKIQFTGDVWSLGNDPPNSNLNSGTLNALRVPVFVCPADRSVSGATNYLMCAGTSTSVHITPFIPLPNSSREGFGRTARGIRGADVSDGLSLTIAFSERLTGDGNAANYTPSRDIAVLSGVPDPLLPDDGIRMCSENVKSNSLHMSYNGIGWLFHLLGQTTYNQIQTPNSSTPDCSLGAGGNTGVFTARSLHPNGVYVLFGDGAVRFVNQTIDQNVWRALGTTNSGDRSQLP